MSIIKKYLEDLESRIDSGIEEELLSSWKRFIVGKLDGGLFVPSRRRASSPAMTWPNVSVNEALDDMGRNFANQFADFPKVSEYVRIYHPDLQGPMDVCELLWGSELFLAMLDTPDLVHASLKLITETYIMTWNAYFEIP